MERMMRAWAVALCLLPAAGWAETVVPEPAPEPAPAEPAAAEQPAEEPVETIETIEAVEMEPVDENVATPEWYGEAFPVVERAFSLMNGRTLRPQSFLFVVQHRTNRSFVPGDRDQIDQRLFYDFLGFDAGNLKIGLALRWGVIENLDVGILRQNGTVEPFDTYEFDARYQLLRFADQGADLAVRLGGSWFAREDNQALGVFGQVIGSTIIANRLTLGAGLLYHSDSTSARKVRDDTKFSAAAQALLQLRLSESVAIDAESAYSFAGFNEHTPIFTIGPKLITNRHTFTIVVSNSPYLGADGVVANTERGPSRWILGFNITREL